MIYFVIYIINGIIWGIATQLAIENKGYREKWFWWGFFFGIIAFLVAMTKYLFIKINLQNIQHRQMK